MEQKKEVKDSSGCIAGWAFPITDGKMVYLTFSKSPNNKDADLLLKYLKIIKPIMDTYKNEKEKTRK